MDNLIPALKEVLTNIKNSSAPIVGCQEEIHNDWLAAFNILDVIESEHHVNYVK